MRSNNNSVPPPTGISLSTRAKRRPRTTPTQRKLLQSAFQKDPYPSKDQQRALATNVGFSVESLHFWFQNQRQLMRRQAKDTKQISGASGGGSSAVSAARTPILEQRKSPFSTSVASAPSGAPSHQRQQDQERYTFYSPHEIQSPLASHLSMSSPSVEDGQVGFYTTGSGKTDAHAFHHHHQQQQQQQQQLRLPPFSTLVPQQEQQQEQQQTSGMASTATAAMVGASGGGFSSATSTSFTPSAFTPTRPVPLPSLPSSSVSSSTLVIHPKVPSPGSARNPPIHFFFHHPEYGIEACMRQLSSRFEDMPNINNLHHY